MARCLHANFKLLCVIFLIFRPAFSFEIGFSTVENCKTEKKFFQVSNLQCVDCDVDKDGRKVVSTDGLSCTCNQGFRITEYFGGPTVKCSACASGEVTSEDKWFCLSCQTGSAVNGVSCKPECPENRIAIDRDSNGTPRSQRLCLECQRGTAVYPRGELCQRCPSCELSFPTVAPKLKTYSTEITYDNGVKFESGFFEHNFVVAKTLCETKFNYTACQLLGNLCVMLDYKSEKASACQEYLDLVSKPPGGQVKVKSKTESENANWPEWMPWLYYLNSQEDAPTVLNNDDISIKFKIGQSLPFVLAVYAANGSFVDLKTNIDELQMCKDKPSKLSAANKFATLYENSCELSVKKLWEQKDMLFYDLYFKLPGDSLYALPLVLENFKDNRGSSVNNGDSFKNWRLLRRFFLVDNVSGKSGKNQKATSIDQVIRIAEKVEINLRLRNGQGQIFPPFIRIRYKTLTVTQDILNRDPVVSVYFKVYYEMDVSSINNDIKTVVGVLSGVALAYALALVYSWKRRGGIEVIGFGTMLHFIAFVLGALSTMYFWILFGMSTLWLIFFKEQDIVYRLLPTSNQENIFRNLLIISFVFKLVDLYHVISFQINIDVFFIDWERPRPLPRGTNQSVDAKAPVSVWRTLFIGNEWNELQTLRKISPEIQIGLVLFFLKAAGFEHLTTTDPVRRYSVDPTTEYVGEQSHLLRFAVAVLLYMSIAFIQWLFFSFIYERFLGDPFGDFIDLCSMANVSVMIFQSKLYGYYLHGRSVHGRSDTDMLAMHEQFKREEDDLCGKRGLEPNSEKQTFEVMVTRKFRATYDRFYEPIRSQTQNMERRNVPPIQGHSTGVNLSVAVQQRIEAYSSVNKFLSAFIDHSLRDVDYAVKNKLLFERILDLELGEMPQDKAIMYNDDARSFTNVFFFGHEWTLLLWDFLFFAIVDYIAMNFVLAAVLTYFQSRIVKALREFFGEKNLARKTLVDERFLI